MNAAPRPLDDIRALLKSMPGPDEAARAAVRARDAELTKPAGSLGRLETSVQWLAARAGLLCLGEMGIGNTTIAAAIYHAFWGGAAQDWVGRGTGVDDEGLKRKAGAVAAAVALHREHLGDPLEVLRRLGGREIAAIAGAILAARIQRVPVLLDGFVVCAAAAVLHALDASALHHCMAGHVSAEAAHAVVLRRLRVKPGLELGLRAGPRLRPGLPVGIRKGAPTSLQRR